MRPGGGPGGPCAERLSDEVIRSIADEIRFCDGNEVFFIGRTDHEGVVVEAEPVARGNPESVPAVAEIAEAGDVLIHNHPTGILVPSEADIAIASRFGGQGIGFYIVDNDVQRLYAVVEPREGDDSPEPLDPQEVAELLGPEGPLASIHPNYESRTSQCRMAADVTGILERGGVGVLEAGTGTGKSLAYLIPSVLWALRGKRRVVVSTRTINLQEQHLDQDLPLVRKVLGEGFRAVIVKGRANYLCLRKRDMLDTDSGEILLEFDDVQEMRELLHWSRVTSDGSLSDLPFVPRDSNWDLMRAESDSCLRARCTHFSACFFYRARMEAASAQILLANHHILFADLALRSAGHEAISIMPRYDAVVLDEAHNVEDVALSYFDSSVGRWGLLAQFGRLVSRRRSERGLIPFLIKRVPGLKGIDRKRADEILGLGSDVLSHVETARVRLDGLFEDLAARLSDWLAKGPAGSGSRWRIPLERRNDDQWVEVERCVGDISDLVAQTLAPLRRITRRLKTLLDGGVDEIAGLWGDLAAVVSRLDAAVEFLGRILDGEGEGEVFWVEVRRRRGRSGVNLHLTPLEAADILRNTLFDAVGQVVMTSATLTVGGTFQFIRERLGLDHLEDMVVVERVYESPFDLQAQMRLALVDDLPEPGRDGFVGGMTRAVNEMIRASEGGALVLFTSYRTLDAVFERCLEELGADAFPLARQGEAQRTALLERFRTETGLTLFATDSFWEGVDVVGDSLRCVAIARLPFPVPTDPLVEARGELLVRQGRDPFMDDSVPRAVIKLRQGVGRLIRHRDDRGYAVICDTRILSRAYGRIFLASFPEDCLEWGNTERIAANLKRFLGGG